MSEDTTLSTNAPADPALPPGQEQGVTPTPSPDAPFTTAADTFGVKRDQPPRMPGLSISPGLRELPDSPVPGMTHNHVMGPQQAACDPVAAGLDVHHDPMTRAENRVITKADGTSEPAPTDRSIEATPGPTGATAPAAAEPAPIV